MTEEERKRVEDYQSQGIGYNVACSLVGVRPSSDVMSGSVGILDDVEFQEICRLRLPLLLDRLMRSALVTDDEKFLLQVVKELSDRGYGKAVQSVQVVNPKRDIRAAWGEYDIVDVSEEMGGVE